MNLACRKSALSGETSIRNAEKFIFGPMKEQFMQKKRLARNFAVSILSLLIFLASAQAACAVYKRSVHKEWHIHMDNFTMDGIFFEIKAGGVPTKIVVSAGQNTVVVANGTCVDSANMSICLIGVKMPEEELHKIYVPEDYEYHVQIYYYLADISITKSIDKTSLLIGEKARVDVEVMNNGSQIAENVRFRDSYPGFYVSNVIGCSFDKNNATWNGILNKNQVKKCSYYIEPYKGGEFKSVAKAAFLEGFGVRERTVSSSSISITVPDYELRIERAVNQTEVWVGGSFAFNLTLKNTHKEKSLDNVELSLSVPEGLETLMNSGSLSKSGSMLRWSGRIGASENRAFWAVFRVRHNSTNTLKTNVNYMVSGLRRMLAEQDNITGLIDSLAFQYISFAAGAESGKNVQFNVNVNNPSGSYVFRKLKAYVSTTLPIQFSPLSYENIGIRQFREILSQNVTLPQVSESKVFDVEFKVEYESEYRNNLCMYHRSLLPAFLELLAKNDVHIKAQ